MTHSSFFDILGAGSNVCSCIKSNLPCTHLCQCQNCANKKEDRDDYEDVSTNDEDSDDEL